MAMSRSDLIALANLLTAVVGVAVAIHFGQFQGGATKSSHLWWLTVLINCAVALIWCGMRIWDRRRPFPPIKRLLVQDKLHAFETALHTEGVDHFFPQYKLDALRHRAFWECNPESLIVFRNRNSREYEGSCFLAGLSSDCSEKILLGQLFVPDLRPEDILPYEKCAALHLFGLVCVHGREESSQILFCLNEQIDDLFTKYDNIQRLSLHAISQDHIRVAKLLCMDQITNDKLRLAGRTLWVLNRRQLMKRPSS